MVVERSVGLGWASADSFPFRWCENGAATLLELCRLSAFIYELLGSTPLFGMVKTRSPSVSVLPRLNGDSSVTGFIPLLRSGAWADIGSRSSMEDVYVCADNLMRDYGLINSTESPSAFYEVFDGDGGKHAADVAFYHLPKFIVEDEDFPQDIERIIASAFLHTDTTFAEACSSDADLDSGTTALAAVVIGRILRNTLKSLGMSKIMAVSISKASDSSSISSACSNVKHIPTFSALAEGHET